MTSLTFIKNKANKYFLNKTPLYAGSGKGEKSGDLEEKNPRKQREKSEVSRFFHTTL